VCAGERDALVCRGRVDWQEVDSFISRHHGDYIVAMLSYDLKDAIEPLKLTKQAERAVPDLVLIVPESVYLIKQAEIIHHHGPELPELVAQFQSSLEKVIFPFQLEPLVSKTEYETQFSRIRYELQQGNIYEMNYCIPFEQQNVAPFDEINLFRAFQNRTDAPFSAFFRFEQHTMIGASPERYLKKEGERLYSQPIKGTRKRGRNEQEDAVLKEELRHDPKERSENVMIVDLVRNDLARIAVPGTVRVDELFGVYSFSTVHQLISTISCELRPNTPFSEIVKATFPMGSMTGAPKIRAMEVIDAVEFFSRGWYSGSIGLITPNGDFDLNVVIRSLFYDAERKTLSYPVGSAITIQANAQDEYEECALKLNSLLNLLRE
jgi:para-aminobenzoate synthetase component I